MIKKTLYFGNPAYLSSKNEQMVIKKSSENESGVAEEISVPIEDIGIVVIDHFGVTISQYLISLLIENNVSVIICNKSHLPNGLFLNLDGNTVQSEIFKAQIKTSRPLLKNLWSQTVTAKIINQAGLLKLQNKPADNLLSLIEKIKSGDTSNVEARASVYYWRNLFPTEMNFIRDRYGEPPNNLLNYGYAVLRAIVARGLVASGLLPTLGIHHRNKYNAYCLADDVMEPYRPFVDLIVCNILKSGEDYTEITTNLKKKLLDIATADIFIDGERSPLMVGLQRTTSSLANCYGGGLKKIIYPGFAPESILRKKRKKY
ncbi:MAG: type II CRISPR-associated endonuclease Cas1 [Ignavibacteria bacterium]|jgi:CRISPR-associated protein Cas1